jgi:hypothetical protein
VESHLLKNRTCTHAAMPLLLQARTIDSDEEWEEEPTSGGEDDGAAPADTPEPAPVGAATKSSKKRKKTKAKAAAAAAAEQGAVINPTFSFDDDGFTAAATAVAQRGWNFRGERTASKRQELLTVCAFVLVRLALHLHLCKVNRCGCHNFVSHRGQ